MPLYGIIGTFRDFLVHKLAKYQYFSMKPTLSFSTINLHNLSTFQLNGEKGRSVMAYIWPIYGLYMAYTRPIYGPYMAYIRPIAGLYMADIWPIHGLSPCYRRCGSCSCSSPLPDEPYQQDVQLRRHRLQVPASGVLGGATINDALEVAGIKRRTFRRWRVIAEARLLDEPGLNTLVGRTLNASMGDCELHSKTILNRSTSRVKLEELFRAGACLKPLKK